MAALITDTGPLVAYLDLREENHAWVKSRFEELTTPLYTCESVLAESAFLLARKGHAPTRVFDLLETGVVVLGFDLNAYWKDVRRLLRLYSDQPMSVADACLVRMSELHRESVIFTLDRDFLIYRRNGRQKIPLLAPFA